MFGGTRRQIEAADALIHALPHAHLWIIYPKGAGSALPESATSHIVNMITSQHQIRRPERSKVLESDEI